MRKILFLAMMLWAAESWASTINVGTPYGPTEVATAMSSASNGDTVLMPASQSVSWTAAVTLDNSKCLTLDLNGSTVTLSGASGTFTVQGHASCMNRVTNGTVTKSGTGYTDYEGPFIIADTDTSYAVRVDHITFRGTGLTQADGTYVKINAIGKGLLDHCTFLDMGDAYEFIHVTGWGAVDTTGWTTSVDKGGAGLFYIEDNTFTNPSTSHDFTNWIQTYYGARVVFRYNTLNFVSFDSHGTAGNQGTRWWEFYKNTLNHVDVADNFTTPVNLRAGSGMVFLNTGSTGNHNTTTGMCEEDSGYPADYQIGRGNSQTSDPAYYFSNTNLALGDVALANACDAPGLAGMVAFNRDVYSDSNSASCTAGGACTSGVGTGTTLPTTCTVKTGFWKTDAGGDWDTTHGGANDGALYECLTSNTWTLSYTPYTYPHPLQSGASSPGTPSMRFTMAVWLAFFLLASSSSFVRSQIQPTPIANPELERVLWR